MKGKLILVDGHSIMNRAFYGVSARMTNKEGLPTNAIYGFLNIVLKAIEDEKADHVIVAFDLKDPTFRHKMYQEYKGTRKPMPDELHQQIPIMKEVLESMNIPHVEVSGYEADDILGTLSKQAADEGLLVSILSGDRDLLQLATDQIKIRMPKTVDHKTEIFNYYAQDVIDTYGVTPTEFIDMKALMGDASDNIPGVPSIGEKTAASLIKEYHSIEAIKAHIADVKPPKAKKALEEHYDMAVLSKELATICLNAPISFSEEDSRLGDLYNATSYEMFRSLDLKSFYSRFDESVIALHNTDLEKKRTKNINTHSLSESADTARALKEFIQNASATNIRLGLFGLIEDRILYGLGLAAEYKDNIEAISIITGPIAREQAASNNICTLLKEGLSSYYECTRLPIATYHAKDLYHFIPTLGNSCSCFDIEIGAYLLDPLKSGYSYDEIAASYAKCAFSSREDLLGKTPFSSACMLNANELEHIAVYGACAALLCEEPIKEKLLEDNMYDLFTKIEMPTAFSLARMEEAGILVDKEMLMQFSALLTDSIEQIENRIYEAAGGTRFNINSPKQLGEILFEKLAIPGAKKTKGGYSTSADILDKLAPDYPIVADILNYRQLTKLRSTYAEGLQPFIESDGRIHGCFHQTITATGRISSTEPNLQNIPTRTELGRELRKAFVPAPGCVFVDADYSQIELRILAHLSKDANLIGAYKNAEDIHAMTASSVFGVPLSMVTADMRRSAKAVNFGIVYGISAFGLSEDLNITKKEAAEYIERYFAIYPGIKTYLEDLVHFAKEHGYSLTAFQRRRPIPELKSSNFMQRQFGERIAMNAPIQGTAADVMKLAMIMTEQALTESGLDARIVLQVHDELLIEVSEKDADKAEQIVTESMKQAVNFSVMLEVSAMQGHSWYETK